MLVHIGLKIVKSISVMLLFTKRQIFRLVQTESITDDKINVIEKLKFCLERVENIVGKGENVGEFFKKGRKHCGKRKKLPVTSNFSRSYSVFKRLVLQTHKKPGLFWERINSLPNDKIWGLTKFKAFADDNFNVAKMMISLFDRVENTVGKGENAGYQHFLLFPHCFQRLFNQCPEKSCECMV